MFSDDPRWIGEFVRSQGGEVVYKPLRVAVAGDKASGSFTGRLTEDKLIITTCCAALPDSMQQTLVPKAFELASHGDRRLHLDGQYQTPRHAAWNAGWRRAPEEIKARAFELPSKSPIFAFGSWQGWDRLWMLRFHRHASG